MFFHLATIALLIEAAAGYPDMVFRRIGHPIGWLGRLTGLLDRSLNRPQDSPAQRRAAGIFALAVLIAVAGGAAGAVQLLFGTTAAAVAATALIASALLAQRSLHVHVAAVATALETGGLAPGRHAVAQIVGRDPETLDEAAVCRAAIESLSENFSDGVVAPALWLALGSLPGGAIYKAVNTADSMIGHRTPRHEAFGWAAARFDDLINLPASRLAGLLIVAASALLPGASPSQAWAAMIRDAQKHRSPNAGWPEAAMASALGLALAGPRSYGGVAVDGAFMGEGGRDAATPADIRRALALYRIADALLIGLFGLVAAAVLIWRG